MEIGRRLASSRQRRHVADEVAARGHWFHSIDLGHGIVTPGSKNAEFLGQEWASLRVPDLNGKSVLDIGAWDGFFSFEAERRGAARVVALDHYAWMTDWARYSSYFDECHANGQTPLAPDQLPSIWRPEELPGVDGFDLARRALDSQVERVVDDFMTMDLSTLGQFDVVLYLGVLYHMADPVDALRRLATVASELVIIETQGVALHGLEAYALFEFFPAIELAGDPTNWWAPNLTALKGLCGSAGFSRVEAVNPGPLGDEIEPGKPNRCILVVHARK